MNGRRNWAMVMTALASMGSSGCYAFVVSGDWTANAFLSAAVLSSNENNFLSHTDDAYALDFLEAGITSSGSVTDSTRLAAQVLSRKVGDVDNGSVRVDFIYLQQALINNENGNLAVRVGRVKRPVGLEADTREVAFTRTSVLSPQTAFYDFARNTALSQDGILFAADINTLSHQFSFEYSEAYPRTDSQDLNLILGFSNSSLATLNMDGHAKSEISPTYRFSWEWIDYNFRLVSGGANLNYRYEFDPASIFHSGDIRVTGATLGAEKTIGSWVLSAEYIDATLHYRDMKPLPDEARSYSYYYQALYHFSPSVYGLIRRENTYELEDDRNGRKMEAFLAGTPFAQPAYRFYNQETTLSVSWQRTANLLLRAEMHLYDGAASARNEPDNEYAKNWRLYALQVSLRF